VSDDLRPIFLFSLPRAGSTFVQRVLAAHPAIATASEPWILLPFVYSLRSSGVYADYAHPSMVGAVEDFCAKLPGGVGEYRRQIHDLVLRLYREVAGEGASYFLDKTPRYHLIVEEIIEMFPEGKFVFLWRNPLASAASMMQTWKQGRWNLDAYWIDLYEGLACLVEARARHENVSHAVRYEDLLVGEGDWQAMFEYLELPFDRDVLTRFSDVTLSGRMGDLRARTGSGGAVSDAPTAWPGVLSNPVRRVWARRYLRWVGEDRLALMGYRLSDVRRQLDAAPLSAEFTASDIGRMAYGAAARKVRRAAVLGRRSRPLGRWGGSPQR